MQLITPIKERFWKYVQRKDKNVCWEWKGGRQPYGYGGLWDNSVKNSVGAHIVSWKLHHKKPIPKGMEVLHRCDNPPCVNPWHLFLGTQQDNRTDSVKKNRTAKGESHGKAILTERIISLIRKLYVPRRVSTRILARKFHTSQSNVMWILKNHTWTHVQTN